ncbi:MAG: hypothetical protein DRI65_17705 [Chloroflexota bacterium]|nr:MAG: hypothetical protein DRI65_17705 [Chloroflexota bacterium]
MTWEYRVCREHYDDERILDDERDGFTIREVHYWDDDETKIHVTTEREMAPFGLSLDQIKSCLEMMTKALDKPVIDLDTLEYYEPTDEEYDAYSDDDGDLDDGIPFN